MQKSQYSPSKWQFCFTCCSPLIEIICTGIKKIQWKPHTWIFRRHLMRFHMKGSCQGVGKWPCYSQKSNYRAENVISGQNVTSGSPLGSFLESILLISDLEEIVNGEIVQFEALWIKCHSDYEQIQKDGENRVDKRVTDEPQCIQREETKSLKCAWNVLNLEMAITAAKSTGLLKLENEEGYNFT